MTWQLFDRSSRRVCGWRRWRAAVALCAFGSSLHLVAAASENYPAIIDRQTGVQCPRPLTRCRICHDSAAGGEGTANQPFALALKMNYGLSGGKAGRELARALQNLPDDLDTDEDGTPDLEELAGCMNPSGPELSAGPGYGCNASLSRAPGSSGASGCSMFFGLALLVKLRGAGRRCCSEVNSGRREAPRGKST
jgi:hypothetical protein